MKDFKPIFVDIETSGIDFVRCGIWQIGAVDLSNPKSTFLQEGRIDDEDEILNLGNRNLFEVIGKTEEQLRDKNKQSQRELLLNFFDWVKGRKMKNFSSQNPQFDVAFLTVKTRKYELKMPYHYRAFDLHTLAQDVYSDLHGKFLVRRGQDHSGMDLTNVLELCGLKDERKEHNGLEDAKLGGECFSRLKYGESIFPEYKQFSVPRYLLKREKKIK